MLYEEGLIDEIDTKQISTCHKYASICFKTRELLLEFCNNEHLLLPDTPVLFSPDYHERIRISIENLPIELSDKEKLPFEIYNNHWNHIFYRTKT